MFRAHLRWEEPGSIRNKRNIEHEVAVRHRSRQRLELHLESQPVVADHDNQHIVRKAVLGEAIQKAPEKRVQYFTV